MDGLVLSSGWLAAGWQQWNARENPIADES
jgi:hypothetical protein